MTTLRAADDTSEADYTGQVNALTEAMSRLAFDPYVDIDWDKVNEAYKTGTMPKLLGPAILDGETRK